MGLDTADEPEQRRVERHASWAELFFDLVAAAGVATLAHVLGTAPDAAGAWSLYPALPHFCGCRGQRSCCTATSPPGRPVYCGYIGMFGLGVMATFVPGVAHTVFGGGQDLQPSNVYAIAYVATRIYGSLSWRRGEVLLDFPVVQYSVGLLPWIVSIWVDEPWKLALWTVGVGIDLLLVLVASGSKILEQSRRRSAHKPDLGVGQGATDAPNGQHRSSKGCRSIRITSPNDSDSSSSSSSANRWCRSSTPRPTRSTASASSSRDSGRSCC